MNTELKPPTTQAEALRLLDEWVIGRENVDRRIQAYYRLKELIKLLLPE